MRWRFANGLPKRSATKTYWKIDSFTGFRRISNGALRLDWRKKAAPLRKRATGKFAMNFPGENNGHRLRARETMARRRAAAPPCRWEVSSRTHSAFTIWGAMFGNGAWKVTREIPRERDAIGACSAAVLGRQAVASKCNRPIATW